jgi:diaminopimelate epimerase
MINFSKYNSCGNDFIIIDNSHKLFPLGKKGGEESFQYIQSLCDRTCGVGSSGRQDVQISDSVEERKIGADGLILIQPHESVIYFMSYFNSNGYLSSFCGNGSMCTAHFAVSLGFCDMKPIGKGDFKTREGLFSFESDINTGKTKISMIDVLNFFILDEGILINTGSPHYVIFKSDISNMDVKKEGKDIRYSKPFYQYGINVTFASFSNNMLSIRTYERGVESETLSCGTGAVAAALSASIKQLTSLNRLPVHTKGGVLDVSFKQKNRVFTDVFLESVVCEDYRGEIIS